jgi:hypothetical protein
VEIYTLDPLLRRENVIDQFESLIWTERFLEFGDFQLDIASTNAARSLLKADTWLAMNESHRVMRIESIEDAADSDNRRMLTVKGRSIESILLDRVVSALLSTWATTQKWTFTGPPASVMRKIFHDFCVTGVLSENDVIPFIVEGSFLSPSTIAEPVDPITVDLDPTTVYDAIKNIGDVWNLGFRILRNYDASQLYFDVYTGSDRTTSQSVLPPVIFTPELDNLENTKELTSIDKAKNTAYVYSPAGFQMVYGLDVDPEVEGFERRVLVVNADDITDDNPDVTAALIQRGNEELAKYRTYQAFDGEISQFSQFKYGTHYNLGDIIEMRNTSGVTNNMRVTEQIFVSDQEGERAYPTLSLNTFINTGSWLSWLNNKTWSELTTEEWATQP